MICGVFISFSCFGVAVGNGERYVFGETDSSSVSGGENASASRATEIFRGRNWSTPLVTELKAMQGASGSICQFDVEPGLNYAWDDTCEFGKLGCKADGRNVQCRFCGTKPYPLCPPSSPIKAVKDPSGSECKFDVEPGMDYSWDDTCEFGKLGCRADGRHVQCRFCGTKPYPPCPASSPIKAVKSTNGSICQFDVEPKVDYAWDDSCEFGKLGCKADGRNVQCRFCGIKPFSPCPSSPITTTSATTLTRTSTSTTTMLAHDIAQPSGANALDNSAASATTSLRNGRNRDQDLIPVMSWGHRRVFPAIWWLASGVAISMAERRL